MTAAETLAQPVSGATATALSVAPAALEWLRSARPALALHVFDRAVYIIDDRDGIVLLTAPPVPMGPFTILANLPERSFFGLVKVDDPAAVRNGRLSIGQLRMRFDTATQWPSAPDWRTIQGQALSWFDHLPTIRQVLREETRHGIFAAILWEGAGPEIGLDAALALRARTVAASLLECLSNDAVGQLPGAAAALAGLGTGFTPAGDDFLLGTMFALWAVLSADEARQDSDILFEAAAPRTTRASAAWLAAAARGEAAEPWHRFFHSLMGDSPEEVASAAREILRTGHTSGEDALIGFICTVASLSNSKAP